MNLVRNLCILALAALFQVSCVTSGHGSGRTGRVEVASTGIIRYNGEPVPVDRLGSALKKRGYSSLSTINVHVPDDFSQSMMKTISSSLAKSGFRRVLFVKPQHATSAVSEKKP